MANEARIRELVEEILESNRAPEDMCAGDLELLAAVRQRLGQVSAVKAQLADFFPEASQTPKDVNTQKSDAPVPKSQPACADDALAILTPCNRPGVLGMLDHYEVLEVVGSGGMGVVYKARDTKLQRIVAIKALAPALAADGTARKRFVREAQAAAAVRDDHVVGIHAVCDDGPVAYLVMEFISGTNLAAKVKKCGPLELKEILRIGMQTAAGLAAAHKQGLIHRDIKPANILLENSVQRVKIADFGLAHAADNAHLTQSGVVLGSPLYMSPEQAQEGPVDHRSDLFSLGSTLYTLCTGRAAFAADNGIAVLKRVCEDTPRPIRAANPELPDWLQAIVNKLLAKDPKDRYQSAEEVVRLLSRHLADLQHPDQTTATFSRQVKGGAYGKPLVNAVLALVLLALLAGVAGFIMWQQSDPENPTVSKSGNNDGQSAPKPHETGLQVPPKNKPEPPPSKPDPRVLTVSKNPKDKAQFRTINEALDQLNEPDMTIRVLDDAIYDEQILIDNPAMHRGLVLEAVGGAGIRDLQPRDMGQRHNVFILGVPKVTLRGFKIIGGSPTPHSLVLVNYRSQGVTFEGLQVMSDHGDCAFDVRRAALEDTDEPIVIKNSVVKNCRMGIYLEGIDFTSTKGPPGDIGAPMGRIIIKNNYFDRCGQTAVFRGVLYDILLVGNTIVKSGYSGIDLMDLFSGTVQVTIANNTLWSNVKALRFGTTL